MDLAPILIAASSSNPQEVQAASAQLEGLSTSDPLFLSHLVSVVLVPSVSLPTAAGIFGLVHLKNLVSNSTQWYQFDRTQQEFLINSLFQHLRQNPTPSPFVSEILGRVFRHEWSHGSWPEELWNTTIELGAWTPLRRCVQRAAALRLTSRRRVLASHICAILPRLVGLWIESNSSELLHTIYTCITVVDASAAGDMMLMHSETRSPVIPMAGLIALTMEEAARFYLPEPSGTWNLSPHLSEHLEAILPLAIEELIAGEAKMKEVGLRCAQFLLEVAPGQWCGRVDALLAMTATLPVEPLVAGRRMALLVRRALVNSNSLETIRQNCIEALLQLTEYFVANFNPRSFRIAIHLAATHCLSWLFENPLFPPDTLSKAPASTLQQILDCLASLTQEVEEVETQLLILRYLQSIFENADVEMHFGCFINTIQRLWQIGEGTMTLRAGLVDLITTVMRALNADVTSAAVISASGQLTCLTIPSVLLPGLTRFIRVGCDEGDGSGDAVDVEVLGDSCLRLWYSLVAGSGAVWFPPLESLMPLLTDSQCSEGNGCEAGRSKQTLYDRLETAEQAQLFFGIATGCLRLAASSQFLTTWTEAFWRPLVRETITVNAMRADIVAAKFVNSALDVPVDEKCDLLLEQLRLLAAWCSQLIQFRVAFPPSVCYLLILHARVCLLQSPVEVHNDSAFKSNQLRLLLLAQLATSSKHWKFLLALLTTVEASASATRDFQQDCLLLSDRHSSVVNGDRNGCQRCLDALLKRLLDRADALSNRLHRRCFALASIYCLRYLTPSDQLYAEYLEPVVSLCVQVLHEVDDCRPATAVDETAWIAPSTLALSHKLKASLQHFLDDASAIVATYVDSALLSQFNAKLF
ncbi:hypothetical protein TcWFU_006507 [Taenia crassiceps]|uniref:Uncharacterized protein n=1 Tax=Taenia crassiceps TaxID=6207 RepID=A0ABR4Q2D8_9CEST